MSSQFKGLLKSIVAMASTMPEYQSVIFADLSRSTTAVLKRSARGNRGLRWFSVTYFRPVYSIAKKSCGNPWQEQSLDNRSDILHWSWKPQKGRLPQCRSNLQEAGAWDVSQVKKSKLVTWFAKKVIWQKSSYLPMQLYLKYWSLANNS